MQLQLVDANREMRLLEQLLRETGIHMIPRAESSHNERMFQIAVAILEARARMAGDSNKVIQITRVVHLVTRKLKTPDIQEVRALLEGPDGWHQHGVGLDTIALMREIVDASVVKQAGRARK
ncbi:MAG: hypothetical protein Q8P12_00135 [bacterium]|nr:hypothetical protein [bacterium]